MVGYIWAQAKRNALARLTLPQRALLARVQAEQTLARLERDWDESKHPRVEGGPGGGQFTDAGGGGGGSDGDSGGLDPKVISVGGDEWNKATARRLEREYQQARSKVEKIATEGVGKTAEPIDPHAGDVPSNWQVVPHPSGDGFALQSGANGNYGINPNGAGVAKFGSEEEAKNAIGQYAPTQPPAYSDEEEEAQPVTPEEWDQISNEDQETVKDKWFSENLSSLKESEHENWLQESGPDDALTQVAYDFNTIKNAETEWADDALGEVLDSMKEEGTKIPFDAETLLSAITLNYAHDGNPHNLEKYKDKIIEFDDKTLNEAKIKELGKDEPQFPGIDPPDYSKLLTKDMRDEIRDALIKAFDKRADHVLYHMDVPDYVEESAKEFADQLWDEMSDEDKFKYAKDYTKVLDEDESAPVVEPSKKYVGSIDALPNTYDPLNDTSGQDYKRTQALAKYVSVERAAQIIVERGLHSESQALRQHVARIDSSLWGAWKGSSTSPNGILLQVATAEELGGRLNTKTSVVIDIAETRARADKVFEDIGGYAGIKAYVRGKWETTQYLLDKSGKGDLELYRGINLKEHDAERYAQAVREKRWPRERQLVTGSRGGSYEIVPTIKVDRNGAASATTDISVANGWKSGAGGNVVLRAYVPRTAVVSVPAYGINNHSEREVVIAGTAWKSWDAWLGKAPDFKAVPMGPNGTGIGTNAPKVAAAA
jgi:hypothetical protein